MTKTFIMRSSILQTCVYEGNVCLSISIVIKNREKKESIV